MKQLKSEDKYPAELWEETNAPTWDAERVWRQISAESTRPTQKKTYWWLPGVIILFLWVSNERSPITLQAFPLNTSNIPSEHIEAVLPEGLDLDKTGIELPVSYPIEVKKLLKPANISSPELEFKSKGALDTLQRSRPTKAKIPIAGLAPREIPLLKQEVTPLPLSSRPGTKLTMRLPKLEATPDSASYLRRMWVQLKRFSQYGDVKWEELGIHPNGDGTFSIIPAKKPNEEEQNN
jgi:hypothetical protein